MTLTRKTRLPSGPNKRTRVHCVDTGVLKSWGNYPMAKTLCYEFERGNIETAGAYAAVKESDPRKVSCPHCLAILRSTSLYNAFLVKTLELDKQ